MSTFLQYPEDELDDIITNNVVLFSVIVVIAVILLSLLLIVLGCLLFGFRRNSCTLSRTRRKIKEEIKQFNLNASTSLAKNQKSLRYLASHPDYNDKFRMIKYMSSNEDKEVEESKKKDIEKGTLDMNEGVKHVENEAPNSLEEYEELVDGLEESVQCPEEREESVRGPDEADLPKYTFPKLLISPSQTQPQVSAPPPDYVFPHLVSLKRNTEKL